jgi:anthranilate synthase component II
MQKILVFDNYDSFTYNLVHLVAKFPNVSVDVFRNDAIELESVAAYDKIILSPGPGIPSEAGMLLDLIKAYAPTNWSIFWRQLDQSFYCVPWSSYANNDSFSIQ